MSATIRCMEALPGQEDAGERPLAQQAQQVEVVDRPGGLDGLQLLLGHQGRGQVRPLQPQQTAQFGRLAGEARQKVLRIDGVSRALADVVFFVKEVAGRPAAGEFREGGQIVFDAPRPTAPRPAIIQIDLDEFEQHEPPHGGRGGGREFGHVRGAGPASQAWMNACTCAARAFQVAVACSAPASISVAGPSAFFSSEEADNPPLMVDTVV